jgi:hypothetical protein
MTPTKFAATPNTSALTGTPHQNLIALIDAHEGMTTWPKLSSSFRWF